MNDEWEPAGYGQCGECGATGEPMENDTDVWVDGPRTDAAHYYAEKWSCSCGCTWWEQYRWRGQTKDCRP